MAARGRGKQSASLIPTARTATMHLTSNISASTVAQSPPQVITTLTELFDTDLQQWRLIAGLFYETVEQGLVNLANAIHGGEDTQIVEAAHRIVDSTRMLGYQAIGDTARRIEHAAQNIRPYQQCMEDIQFTLTCLRALASEFRQQVSGCPWSNAAVAS